MKTVNLLTLLLPAAVILSSCSDDLPVAEGSEFDTFALSLPSSLQTRSFGDGTTAQKLKIAVYPAGENTPIISNFAEGVNPDLVDATSFDSNLEATVSLHLIKNKSYDIVFWAKSYSNATSPYVFNPSDKTITVSYTGANTSDESRDAFYAYTTIVANGSQHNVSLTRPFAQFNIGTNDFDDASHEGLSVASTSLSFSELANTLDLTTGKCSGSVTDVEFASAAIPTSQTFPVSTNMKYLAMAYVLVGSETSDKAILNVGLKLNGTTSTFTKYNSVPAQRNYRTNIYGSLLLNPDSFTVNISNDFHGVNGGENQTNPSQGVTDLEEITPVSKTIDGKSVDVYEIGSAAQLSWVSQQMSEGNLTNAYLELTSDIDMTGRTYEALENFTGSFNGNSHTVSNLTVTGAHAGLIGSANNATISDVTVSGGTINATNSAGAICAIANGNTSLSNCHNVNTFVSGIGSIGGVVGLASGDGVKLTKCSNSGTIDGGAVINGVAGGSGGIIGCSESDNVSISNCSNTGSVGANDDSYAGGIVGRNLSTADTSLMITTSSNGGSVSGIIFAGGIYGGSENGSSDGIICSDCTNTGVVTCSGVAGGIAGLIGSNYLLNGINSGLVNGGTAAGGVAGHLNNGEISGCEWGSISVTATNAGRMIGVVMGENCKLGLTSTSTDMNNNLPSVGYVGSESTDTKLSVNGGEFYGFPGSNSGSIFESYIVIESDSSWDKFPYFNGTWKFVNGTWTMQ